jgi:hypothetical protein
MAQKVQFKGSEVITAAVVKISVFLDVTPCGPLKMNRRFGGTCHLHLQGVGILRTRNQNEACSNILLLGLFFHSEYGGDIFIRNIDYF